MIKYLQHSDISARVSVNPFGWVWMPFVKHEGPTPFFPKRHTYAVGWLALQVFIDLNDGTMDLTKLNPVLDIEEKEVDNF